MYYKTQTTICLDWVDLAGVGLFGLSWSGIDLGNYDVPRRIPVASFEIKLILF